MRIYLDPEAPNSAGGNQPASPDPSEGVRSIGEIGREIASKMNLGDDSDIVNMPDADAPNIDITQFPGNAEPVAPPADPAAAPQLETGLPPQGQPDEPQAPAQAPDQAKDDSEDDPFFGLKPETLPRFKRPEVTQTPATQPQGQQTTDEYGQILNRYGIQGDYGGDQKQLVERLASGYSDTTRQLLQAQEQLRQMQTWAQQQQYAAMQAQAQAQSNQGSPTQPDPNAPPSGFEWVTKFDPAWNNLVARDPETGELVYRQDAPPEQIQAFQAWQNQRNQHWSKYFDNPTELFRDVAKHLVENPEVVKQLTEKVAPVADQRVQQALQRQAVEGNMRDYMGRNRDLFVTTDQFGRPAPSPWANYMFQLLADRQQGGRGMSWNEAVGQFERDYYLYNSLNRPAPAPPANHNVPQQTQATPAQQQVAPQGTNLLGQDVNISGVNPGAFTNQTPVAPAPQNQTAPPVMAPPQNTTLDSVAQTALAHAGFNAKSGKMQTVEGRPATIGEITDALAAQMGMS